MSWRPGVCSVTIAVSVRLHAGITGETTDRVSTDRQQQQQQHLAPSNLSEPLQVGSISPASLLPPIPCLVDVNFGQKV